MYDLYQCNDADTARFILGKDGKKKLFVVGLNPSTANKEKSDTTVRKVETVARSNDFDGFVMINLYPLRSTNPNNLPSEVNSVLFQSNIEKIKAIASGDKKPVFWAAWGGNILLRPYLADALRALVLVVDQLNGQWVNYGELRKDGHPRHPSRLSYAWAFTPFEVKTYVQKFALDNVLQSWKPSTTNICNSKDSKEKPRITFVRPDIDFNDPNLTQEQIDDAIAKCAEEMTSAILGGKQDRYWGEIHRKLKGK